MDRDKNCKSPPSVLYFVIGNFILKNKNFPPSNMYENTKNNKHRSVFVRWHFNCIYLFFNLSTNFIKKIDFKNRVSAFKNISVLFWLKILIMKKNNVSQTKSVQFFYGWTSDWMMERVKSSLFIVLEISYRKQEYQVNQLRKIKKIT